MAVESQVAHNVEVEPRTAHVHGREIAYAEIGSGPVLLLVHGMAGSSENWTHVIELLARNHTVIAPDLPGHGSSEPGGGDYSLGGGVALQFTYQFPEMVERLVLVSSGGLGSEVSLVLRAAALPGADLFISATAGVGSVVGSTVARGMSWVGLRPNPDVAEVARGYASLSDPQRRRAFLDTLRSVVGTGGQRVAAADRLYLADGLPILIVWGENDPIIPVGHAEQAHQALPGSHLEVFEGVGHLPQVEAPGRFVTVLERFLTETEPAEFDQQEWRARFNAGV